MRLFYGIKNKEGVVFHAILKLYSNPVYCFFSNKYKNRTHTMRAAYTIVFWRTNDFETRRESLQYG